MSKLIKERRVNHSPFFVLIALITVTSIIYLAFGGPISLFDFKDINLVLYSIRLPKLFAAIFVGAGLSLAGYVFQIVLRNPLSDPYILGVSSSSSFGVCLFISLVSYPSVIGVELSALFGSFLSILILIFLFKKLPSQSLGVILIGIGISFFFSAINTFLISRMSGPELVYASSWIIGNISQPVFLELFILFIVLITSLIFFIIFSNHLDLLRLGEVFATSSGLNTKKYSLIFITIASVLTSTCIVVTGPLGFLGLVVPHITKLVFKEKTKVMILLNALIGGFFLLLCLLISGFISKTIEIPIGAITAFLGAPFLIYLIYRYYYVKN